MSGDLFPVAGAKIYLGGQLSTRAADFAVSDFASQSWTEIDGWQTMGDYGDVASVIKTSLINRRRTVKQGGTLDAGTMQNNFAIVAGDVGQEALLAAQKSSRNYAVKIVYDDGSDPVSHAVTVTIANPGVFTWAGNSLVNGEGIQLSTTGALPTGLAAATTYYVVGKSGDNFSLSATVGGSAIVTTGTQSGVHTATTVPAGSTDYFIALITSAPKKGGTADTVRMLSANFEINSNICGTDAQ